MKGNQSISPKAVQVDSMYRFIPQSKKRELLRLIIQEQYTIKQAAKKLGLNYSTAKYTVKQSKRLGKIKKVSCFKYGDLATFIYYKFQHQIQYAHSLQNFGSNQFPTLNYDLNPLRSINPFNINSLPQQASYPTPRGTSADPLNFNHSIQQNFNQLRSQNDGDSLGRSQKLMILQEVNKQIYSTQLAIQRTFLLGYILRSQQSPMIQTLFQELQKQLVSIAQNQVSMFSILGGNMIKPSTPPQQPPQQLSNITILNENNLRQGYNIAANPQNSFRAFNQSNSSNACDSQLPYYSPIIQNQENDTIKKEKLQMLNTVQTDFIKQQ